MNSILAKKGGILVKIDRKNIEEGRCRYLYGSSAVNLHSILTKKGGILAKIDLRNVAWGLKKKIMVEHVQNMRVLACSHAFYKAV